MPINNITQTISTIPPAGARGVDVQTQFVIKQEDFQDHLQGITVTELNALKTQMNTMAGEMNTTASQVNTSASTATTQAGIATTKASEASTSATSASTSASTATTSRNQAETFAQQAQASAASVDANNIQTQLNAKLGIYSNATSATKLFTPRLIGGVIFDGSENINLPGVNAKGNQDTSGTAENANKLIGKNWNWSGQGGQPTWVWGGTDGTNMYVYNPWEFNVNYANSAGTAENANKLNGQNFYWSGQGGQPTWVYGGSDGTNLYVYNPSNWSVNYANSAGSVNSVSSSVVGVSTAALGVGAIGSYGFFYTDGIVAPGTNVSGSTIDYSAGTRTGSVTFINVGTWKCMGRILSSSSHTTLFLRIA